MYPLAPRKEEMREKQIPVGSTTTSNEGDRTKEVRGRAPRKEEMREKQIDTK